MKKGIILPFLLLLASVAFILGAFFVLDNKQITTNQKAPENKFTTALKSGTKVLSDPGIDFTFEYPQVFQIGFNMLKGPESFDVFISTPAEFQKDDTMHVTLTVTKNTKGLTLEKYLQGKFDKMQDFKTSDVPRPNSFSYIGDLGGGTQSKAVFFSYLDKFYSLVLYGGGASVGYSTDAEKVFNQMVSTIKFTGHNLDTKTWKTYTNKHYHFKLAVPPAGMLKKKYPVRASQFSNYHLRTQR